MQQKSSIAWAFDDVASARKLWPRVEGVVEAQAAEGHIKLSPTERRHIVRAVVEDLLNTSKSNNTDVMGGINNLLNLFKKPTGAAKYSGRAKHARRSGQSMSDWLRTA